MTSVKTPNTRCHAGVSRCDITPPVGIYHRMWGAALHDQATGVHRPLEATLLWVNGIHAGEKDAQIIISLDHCILDAAEIGAIRREICSATGVAFENILVSLSHTHGSGWMSRSRSHLPGGELIGPYLDRLIIQLKEIAVDARNKVVPATIVYGEGKCQLAAHRDFFDSERGRFVCGFNPGGQADDTILVASIVADSGARVATIVNYACHPTTLAWDNTLISPDWVGAMREEIERNDGGLCLFLQGASGDLGPRDGFVGDAKVADQNGRQVGFAALSAIATLPPPGTSKHYSGPVVSGTLIGTWQHQTKTVAEAEKSAIWQWEDLVVELPYRHDLPSLETTRAEREQWQAEEAKARAAGDESRLRDCRAEVEQRTRQITRLEALVLGRVYPLRLRIGVAGDAVWIFTPGELYQLFQTTIRHRFADRPILITTLTNDWQPGYIPAASAFGYGIYQDVIAATGPGCLETLIESVCRRLKEILPTQ
ncbi:MAG: hypothetical protein ACKO0V_05615 [bacterium]